jgi:CheY-like chemotaxis protein
MPAPHPPLSPFEPALRVLVADDNELNQLVVCRALEEWNVEATLADNGQQAVALAISQAFDAVLMDIQMPEMDGYEATRALRRHQHLQHLPIIGLTASASPQDQAQAMAAGMNTTLPKPFDPALLHASLLSYTRRALPVPHLHTSTADSSATQTVGNVEPEWAILEELAAGNEAFISQIIATFLQQTPELYQQLVVASALPDLLAQARVAHKLKGQIVYFGVPAMLQHLEKLERPLSAPDLATCQHLVEVIGHQLSGLYTYLESRLHTHRGYH